MSVDSSLSSRTERRSADLSTLVVRLAHDLHVHLAAKVASSALSVEAVHLLAAIQASPGLTLKALSARLRFIGDLTELLADLTAQGLITRRMDSAVLTDAGQLALRRPLARMTARQTSLFAHLSATEQARLAALLRKALDRPQLFGAPPVQAS
ncbi:MarR family winged helix-turn-helix transcriptional regulator [Deinococcus radiotolerans]|uniref:MarR family transcriptional regulator n=1 Tax=Deinococcus radiotolerans TaxID=1309407 RepID=A0ABQ2FNB2_9DEIO|nr:MarR family winged helix-turn-helix transcriptional regulator [Deinococcus radiotolerans]GGL10847.1 hypothetical protein GCM10010844_31890 [Deinococcus radiotolerans]